MTDAAARVRLLLETRRYDDAQRIALEGLAGDPQNAELCGLIAVALLNLDDPRSARDWAQRALGIDPTIAWVHRIHAAAILAGAGTPAEAVASATAAVRGNPADPANRYTLVRAYLAARNRRSAEATAEEIRAGSPESPLGPLALALVELDRAPGFRFRWPWVIVVTVLTRGLALVGLLIIVCVNIVRSARPLRRADSLLQDALRLEPGDPAVHVIAAEVLRRRYRFERSMNHDLAAAALDVGMVSADELTRGIAKRNTLAIAASAVWWVAIVATIDTVAPRAVVVISGVALFAALTAGLLWFDRLQTGTLPKSLRRAVERSWWPVAAWTLVSALLGVAGFAAFGGGSGYNVAAAFSFPIALAMSGHAAIRWLRQR